MQFDVNAVFNSTYEIQLANQYPNVRIFEVGEWNISYTVSISFSTSQLHFSLFSLFRPSLIVYILAPGTISTPSLNTLGRGFFWNYTLSKK